MIDILNEFLNSQAPQFKDVIEAAFKVFDKVELPHYEDLYVNLLMLDNTDDLGSTTDKLLALTHELQDNLLRSHEIILREDVTTAQQTFYINAILRIEDYLDLEALNKTVNIPGDPNDIFSELVALVSHKNGVEIFYDIDYVSPAFIGAVKDICDTVPDVITSEEQAQKQKYFKLFNVFIAMVKGDALNIVTLLNEGLDVGFNFTTYLSMLNETIELEKPREIACELVAAALISSDGYQNPINIVQANIDHYINDINVVTKINIEVTKLLLELQVASKEIGIALN